MPTEEIYEPRLPEERDATAKSIITYLPVLFQNDPSGNLEPFLGVVNKVVEIIRRRLIDFPRMLDIDQVPDKFIKDLSGLIGNDFDFFAPTLGSKRLKVKALIDLYKHKGLDYSFRFIWQEYGIQKVVTTKSMSDHLIVLSQQGGLSVEDDADAEFLARLILHDFGDNDVLAEWHGQKASDATIDHEITADYVKKGTYSGKGKIYGINWENVDIDKIIGPHPYSWNVPHGDSTGWSYFGAAFDNNYVYFAPTDATVFVRFNANRQGDDVWRIYDSTAWDVIDQASVIGINQQSAFYGACFDGQYVYFAPYASLNFVRYDTTLPFSDPSSWQVINVDEIIPENPRFLFTYCDFDDRYIYYSPANANHFVRFDTADHGDATASESYFRTPGNWEIIRLSEAMDGTAHVSLDINFAYYGAVYEDPYMYFIPMAAPNFLRFNTDNPSGFTDGTSWERIHKSTALGYSVNMVTTTFVGGVSDGRNIYYAPRGSEQFVKFDSGNGQHDFNDPSAWQKLQVNLGTDTTISEDMFNGVIFDGQYIYFVPDKINLVVRFNTLSTYFQTETSWEQADLKQAYGSDSNLGSGTFAGGVYDGRYVYLAPLLAKRFIRYDTKEGIDNGVFTNYKLQNNWHNRAQWINTDWPRRYRLNTLGDIYIWVYVPDLDLVRRDVPNFRFEIKPTADSPNRVYFEKSISQAGWNQIRMNIDEPHDSTGTISDIVYNSGYSLMEILLNPSDHMSSLVWFDDLKWVDPNSKRGMHGGYIQDGDLRHEGSIIFDTNEWITDNQTLKSLIDDLFPLGFKPFIRFERWFSQEIHPDSTANWTSMGVTRYKILHRRADMNSTWVLANDGDFTLEEHGHVTDDWPPHLRHRSPGPYVVQRDA